MLEKEIGSDIHKLLLKYEKNLKYGKVEEAQIIKQEITNEMCNSESLAHTTFDCLFLNFVTYVEELRDDLRNQ